VYILFAQLRRKIKVRLIIKISHNFFEFIITVSITLF
jgi:hypothetical protein